MCGLRFNIWPNIPAPLKVPSYFKSIGKRANLWIRSLIIRSLITPNVRTSATLTWLSLPGIVVSMRPNSLRCWGTWSSWIRTISLSAMFEDPVVQFFLAWSLWIYSMDQRFQMCSLMENQVRLQGCFRRFFFKLV